MKFLENKNFRHNCTTTAVEIYSKYEKLACGHTYTNPRVLNLRKIHESSLEYVRRVGKSTENMHTMQGLHDLI
jgi:hypothetical protein